jgi:hypothetical protein
MSESLYTWGGKYFGKRDGDSLFTLHGVEAGRFHGDEVFGSDGRYLGEVKNGKLISRKSRSSACKGSFSPRSRVGHVGSIGSVGTVMVAGYEDFPDPDSFR